MVPGAQHTSAWSFKSQLSAIFCIAFYVRHSPQCDENAYVDHSKTGRENFGEACERWIDRDAVVDLLTGPMGHLSYTRRGVGRMIIVGTADEAVKAGRLARHRLAGIELYDDGRKTDRSGFVFPAHAQVEQVAEAVGICVWLMRGCGLRIEEALAVDKAPFPLLLQG